MATIYGPCLNTEHLNIYICLAIHPTSQEDYNPMYKWAFTLLTLSTKKTHLNHNPINCFCCSFHYTNNMFSLMVKFQANYGTSQNQITPTGRGLSSSMTWKSFSYPTNLSWNDVVGTKKWLSTYCSSVRHIPPPVTESNPIKSHSDLVKSQ